MEPGTNVPCANYIMLTGWGGVEVPLYFVILGARGFLMRYITQGSYVCHECGSLRSHRVVEFTGQPSFVWTF